MPDDRRLTNRRRFLKSSAAVAGVAGIAGCQDLMGEEEFPNRDVEIICPWAAGGGTDLTSRQFSNVGDPYLDDEVSYFVSNQTGGGGAAGFDAIRTADTDGHQIGIIANVLTIIPHFGLYEHTYEEFTGIMEYNVDPASITVREDAPYDTIGEFVDYAEDNEVRMGTGGPGDIWHLAASGFALEAGIEFTDVAFDGAAPAIQAVVADEIEATAASVPEVATQVLDGPLKILASQGENRHFMFPDTPTLMEEGYDWSMGVWRAIAGPADMDEEAVEVHHEVGQQVIEDNAFIDWMEENGFGVNYRGPDELDEYMAAEHEKFAQVIEEAGIEVE